MSAHLDHTAPVALTHRRLWQVSAPVILSNATVPLLGAIDTAVVGQIGQAAPIGAVGLGAIILTSFYWIFGFLRMGTSGLVAQAHGAGDMVERGAIMLRALAIAVIAGLSLVVLQTPLLWGAFHLAPASPEVEELAQNYLQIRIWGAPATIALYVLSGWMIATEHTGRLLIVQLWINIINILLDLWFVIGLDFGVSGVAYATLIAECSGCLIAFYLCREAFLGYLRPALARFKNPEAIKLMLRVNKDIMIRSILLQLCFTSFLFMGADQGDVTLAANQVLMQFLQFTTYALDGFAFSAETFVGQAIGRKDPRALRRAIKLCLGWTLAGAALIGVLVAAFGPYAIALITTAPDVRSAAGDYLIWLVFAPILGAAAWSYDGVFIGATLTGLMRKIMFQSALIYALALVVLLPFFGNHGLWAALMCLNFSRSILMYRASKTSLLTPTP